VYAYVAGQTLKAIDPRGLSPDEIKNRTPEDRAAMEGLGKALWNWTVDKVADAVGSFSGPGDPVEAKNPKLRAELKAGGEALRKTFDKVKFSEPSEPVQAGGFAAGKAMGTSADVAGIAGAGAGAVSLVRKGVGALRKAPSLSERLDDVLSQNLDALAGPGGVCFVAGTPVVTATGLVPIENVRVGELVLSKKDDGSSGTRWRRVKETFEKLPSPVLDIEFRARDGQGETFGVTANHPFWKRNLGWLEAGDLRPGDYVWSLNRGWLTVRSVRLRSELRRVYNLEVEDDHTYSVGSLAVWVHNECKGRAPGPARPALEGDPFHPGEVSKRQTELRRQLGMKRIDPAEEVPDQRPGHDVGGHAAESRSAHPTGERNVGSEEHSRVPKGAGGRGPRGSQGTR
jgi:hypothetical protein